MRLLAKARRTVEQALTDLQTRIRRPPSDDSGPPVMSGNMPEDLQTEEYTGISLLAEQARLLTAVRSHLSEDLRFEYLKDHEVDEITWRFASLAHLQPKGDLVAEFIAQHGQDPAKHTCFFPIELLTVKEEVELYGARLLPIDAVERPPTLFGREPGAPIGSVIAVESFGTSREKMAGRARHVAERALRLLRATLREERWLPGFQLRFRLGEGVWFDDSILAGWRARPDEGSDLELDEGLLRHATSQEISKLPDSPTNEVQRRVELALRWFERAQLATDPVVELLYLFFALEAILGNKAEGLKAPALAVRRAMLGLVTSGGFTTHPSRTYRLYEDVRSAAVHGEEPPDIDQRGVDRFAWDVRRAINEFLEYARTEGFTKRAQVRNALDQHERRKKLVAGLLRDDPKLWSAHIR